MFNIIKPNNRPTDSAKLERWLGAEKVEQISQSMVDWYGPPIAVGGVPGNVWAHKGGDFSGPIYNGFEATAMDLVEDFGRRIKRGFRAATRANRAQFNAGFASLSDLISEATTGKRQELAFQKVGPTGVVNATSSLWRVGNQPIGGATAGAVPGGTVCNNSTVGAFGVVNAASGDTLHFIGGNSVATVGGNTLLLYDRLFMVAPNMANATAQAVTGVPTRYQNTTVSTAMDYAGGNFISIEVGGTALAATAHTWDAVQYTDQDGNATITLPTVTGLASAIVDRHDYATGWFAPLASGDTGVQKITQIKCSASVATGVIWFVIGHPLAFMPCPIANFVCTTDGINTAFNLVRIFDGACLAFYEINKPATGATTYAGTYTLCSG